MNDQADKLRQMAYKVKQQIELELAQDQKKTRVVVVSSGKGGVGKSTLALNLALTLCSKGKKVLLMDADLGTANLDIMLGIIPKYNIYHVVQGRKTVQDIIIPGPAGISILPGGSGIQELANLSTAELKRLLVEMGKIDGTYDFMILDTGAGISSSVITFLLAADDAVIIIAPEPTALADAYGLVKTMDRCSYQGNIGIVINRVQDKSEGIAVAEKFKMVCQKYLSLKVILLGWVVNEPLVGEGIRRQQPFIHLYPRSTAARNIFCIADNLLNDHDQEDTLEDIKNMGIRNFFKKIVAAIK
ncbi:MinD/ParA family protein [Syntrophomonas erecta]